MAITVYKTALFKLHKPTKRRRAMLLDSMRRADSAYWKVLRLIELDAKMMADLPKRERRPLLWDLKKKVDTLIKPLPLSAAAKYGVRFDALAQVESYIELLKSGQEASWPEQRTNYDPYLDGLNALLASVTLDEYNAARDLMATKPRTGDPRPLFIPQNDKTRGALLLTDDRKRLFAWINLHPKHSRFAAVRKVGDLVNTRTGEVMSFGSKTGELFPLECSQWHFDKFISKGRIQASRLIYRGSNFYLACTFEYYEKVEQIQAVTLLGVDRGIENVSAWAVVGMDRTPLADGMTSGTELRDYQRKKEALFAKRQRLRGQSRMRWRGYGDQIVHIAANEIVSVAKKYKSQVVLEDLSAISQGPHHKRPKGQRRSNYARVLNRAQYQKLAKVLDYKLQIEGLPPPKFIQPAWTSLTCNVCGHMDKANRPDQATFVCQQCGHEKHADTNAARNIACKHLIWTGIKGKVKKGQKLTEEQKLSGWLAARPLIYAAQAATGVGP